jgi:hypothetical protein
MSRLADEQTNEGRGAVGPVIGGKSLRLQLGDAGTPDDDRDARLHAPKGPHKTTHDRLLAGRGDGDANGNQARQSPDALNEGFRRHTGTEVDHHEPPSAQQICDESRGHRVKLTRRSAKHQDPPRTSPPAEEGSHPADDTLHRDRGGMLIGDARLASTPTLANEPKCRDEQLQVYGGGRGSTGKD